jgi:hypothetical protein
MLRVVIIKPSKYGVTGYVERFWRGFMPNSTVRYILSMTPSSIDGVPIEVFAVDEYVHTDLDYLNLIRHPNVPTLLALVGVQSHQFQRSLDLAAFARAHGVQHCVIGGPHPMTCDTSMFWNLGVSFALSEAENVWLPILKDAIRGELLPAYGGDRRWTPQVNAPVVIPPSRRDLRRYVNPMLGIYPARGCPFTCNFCSVIKIAGRQIRSQPVATTIQSLRAAKAAGVKVVMFTSDNFNKYPDAAELLENMIEEDLRIPFFVQCDTQIASQEALVHLLARAGCFQMFVGVESFQRKTLIAARKAQNHPEVYSEIVQLCKRHNVQSHFSNIIGFPEDTPESVDGHVAILKELNPTVASFYILTPIPGTEQYDEFLGAGWITEKNLDRFDAQHLTWRHPRFTKASMESLLFDCHRKFYSLRRTVSRAAETFLRNPLSTDALVTLNQPVFSRYSAYRRRHPMSGGIGLVRRDNAAEYARFRKEVFQIEAAPLPRSLALSNYDSELNVAAKLVAR